MLIWYQFFSARMGSGGGTTPVVLVHGYFQNRVDFIYLARRLRKSGAGPIYACNFFWPQSLERSSDDVRAFITRVLAETGAEKVDVLTHSSGGLFALDTIGDSPSSSVARCSSRCPAEESRGAARFSARRVRSSGRRRPTSPLERPIPATRRRFRSTRRTTTWSTPLRPR